MSQCPICRKPVTPAHKPFCSQRCADIDLGRWLTESYKLPETPAEPDEDET
ncbi:MAG: DNA gyrase inhibitor YacG [Acidocella sp.]|nr:DNA gyrase inhibitor YacG [Acidocella sp.]